RRLRFEPHAFPTAKVDQGTLSEARQRSRLPPFSAARATPALCVTQGALWFCERAFCDPFLSLYVVYAPNASGASWEGGRLFLSKGVDPVGKISPACSFSHDQSGRYSKTG